MKAQQEDGDGQQKDVPVVALEHRFANGNFQLHTRLLMYTLQCHRR